MEAAGDQRENEKEKKRSGFFVRFIAGPLLQMNFNLDGNVCLFWVSELCALPGYFWLIHDFPN